MNCTNTTFKFLIIRGAVLVIAGWCSACEAFLDIDPPKTEIINEVVFSNDASAVAAMRGIYSIMMTNQSFTNGSIERYTGLSSDELVDISNTDEQQEFYHNTLSTTNQVVVSLFWREAYLYISNANAVLEGLNASGSISPEIKQQLEGEAKFVRAFCQFYLVSLFGAVPYVTSTDYKINSAIARREIQDVYAMIVEDLNDAKALLSDDYSFSRNERSQPNRSAAAALLARVHLFAGDWASAESEATFVIDHTELYALPDDLNSVFLANSQEAIWQLQPVTPEKSTGQARLFILSTTPSSVILADTLINSFETGDAREANWISTFVNGSNVYPFPYKYKVYASDVATEYATVLRLAEQYLIRSEARAHQDKMADAIADIDMIRGRALLPKIADTNPGISKEDLLTAILQERKIEFFAEWGHRWIDLQRTGRAGMALSQIKADWQDTDILYPIPQSERLVNPNLTQNSGY